MNVPPWNSRRKMFSTAAAIFFATLFRFIGLLLRIFLFVLFRLLGLLAKEHPRQFLDLRFEFGDLLLQFDVLLFQFGDLYFQLRNDDVLFMESYFQLRIFG